MAELAAEEASDETELAADAAALVTDEAELSPPAETREQICEVILWASVVVRR